MLIPIKSTYILLWQDAAAPGRLAISLLTISPGQDQQHIILTDLLALHNGSAELLRQVSSW
jgi:hypothetical protein